jgi:hypothetical protein
MWPVVLLLLGVLVYYHAAVLTLLGSLIPGLGWAGGFDLVQKFSVVYLTVGGVALIGFWSIPRFGYKAALLVSVASLPFVAYGLFLLPSDSTFSTIELTAIYWPLSFILPFGVAHKSNQKKQMYLALGVLFGSWLILLIVAPKQPVPLQNLVFYLPSLVAAIPLYVTGRQLAG